MQFWTVIIAASALIASVYGKKIAEAPKAVRHRSSSSSVADWTTISDSSEERTSVRVGVDNGFYAFTYGNANTFAFQSFIVESKHLTILSVSDCFLPGDIFQIYNNGDFMMITNECADGPVAKPTALDLVTCPSACFSSSKFCKNFGYLLPGKHNITIAVVRSASTAGAAFLRIDTACQVEEGSITAYPKPCCKLPGRQACSNNISPYGFADDL